MELYGIIGSPVLHSRSPELHNAAFAACGLEARYLRIAAREAAGALETARRMGLQGLNVTSPYKEQVVRLAGERDAIAAALGAANTLLWRAGTWSAHNTDVGGVQAAMQRQGIRLQDAGALVLGAGGAALAAALALRQAGARVWLAARDRVRADQAASLVGCAACSLQEASARAGQFMLIVSAVSTGDRLLDPANFQPGTVVLDARYQSESALVRDARGRGCVIVDGREWLLFQAVEAFQLFTGRPAPVEAMEGALHQQEPSRGRMLSLVGFMGAGKSTVARLLGQQLGLPVFDTDELIERRTGMPVDGLLRQSGEPALRHWEQRILEELPEAPGVLACGGGLVTRARSSELVRARSRLVVWLWAEAATCVARIGDTRSRPLLADGPETRAPGLLHERRGWYAAASDVVLDTEPRAASDVAAHVSELSRECA